MDAAQRPARGRVVLAADDVLPRRPWVTEGTVEKHVRSILNRLRLPEAADDHRRVPAVLTLPGSRWTVAHEGPTGRRAVRPRQ